MAKTLRCMYSHRVLQLNPIPVTTILPPPTRTSSLRLAQNGSYSRRARCAEDCLNIAQHSVLTLHTVQIGVKYRPLARAKNAAVRENLWLSLPSFLPSSRRPPLRAPSTLPSVVTVSPALASDLIWLYHTSYQTVSEPFCSVHAISFSHRDTPRGASNRT